MKIVVHDFAGHPGQLQLSRELARRGHVVEHQFCASVPTGRGATTRREGDPESFSIQAIDLGKEFARYSPLVRMRQELQYAWMSALAVNAARPDVAIFANVPIFTLFLITLTLRLRKIPYVFWWQDFYSEGIQVVARQRFGWVGGLIGSLAHRVERSVARRAAAIVPITEAFVDQLQAWGIDGDKVEVIPNWGALNEISVQPRVNPWAKEYGLAGVPVVMYTGTLGLKHDPAVITELASKSPADCRVVVVTEGKGREWLQTHGGHESRLMLLDYQPYEQLPDMLASSEVLLVVLERHASRYSVPSKALNYLCAGRPLLALLPPDNAVAEMIKTAGAGIVVNPDDPAAAAASLNRLLADDDWRRELGAAARRYAERMFDISSVGNRFEAVIELACDRHRRAQAEPLHRGLAVLGPLRRIIK
jgi:glycosyltransferase involved in cell wall biosynthesis